MKKPLPKLGEPTAREILEDPENQALMRLAAAGEYPEWFAEMETLIGGDTDEKES